MSDYNLLTQAGAAANVALLVAVATGVLLLIWYSSSLPLAYASLEAIQGRTLGGVVRTLHRYSSDVMMLLLALHAVRTFFARKFGGARWLAWVSGVAMLALIWFIGWTGYWLVWDQPAQQVAVSSLRLMDAVPIFGEPLGRLLVADRTVPSLLFFVVFFLHMLLPLAIAIGLMVHVVRLSRVRLLPRWPVAAALVVTLIVVAVALPAPLDARAQMTFKAPAFSVDAWYLAPLALTLRFQHAGPWLVLIAGVLLTAALPWLLTKRGTARLAKATVDVSRCHACTQCVQDCPFDAIAMVPRTDGRRFVSQAQVDPARCVGCGVCAGSCDSEGITVPWFDTRIEEARIEHAIETSVAARKSEWVAFVGGEIRRPLPALPGYEVHRVPTASWVRPKFVERLRGLGVRGVIVVRDARAEAWARDGGRWVAARFAGERKPVLRAERVAGLTWAVVDYDPSNPQALVKDAENHRRPTLALRAHQHRVLGAFVVAGIVAVAAVGASRVRVSNPTPAGPEFVLSIKAFGDRLAAAPLDPVAEAAKPVHMRGRSTEKPRRADVTVRIEIDGAAFERVLEPKGIAHDGPATDEWRTEWTAAEHHVKVEISFGGTMPTQRWEGTLRGLERRLSVLMYDPATGFVRE